MNNKLKFYKFIFIQSTVFSAISSMASTFISTLSPRKRSETDKSETDIEINENFKNEKNLKNENSYLAVDKNGNKKTKLEVEKGIKEVENGTSLDLKLSKKSEKLRNNLSLSLLSKNGDIDMSVVNRFK
jgi:hypothetical protein